jgi:hypothetical protein
MHHAAPPALPLPDAEHSGQMAAGATGLSELAGLTTIIHRRNLDTMTVELEGRAPPTPLDGTRPPEDPV